MTAQDSEGTDAADTGPQVVQLAEPFTRIPELEDPDLPNPRGSENLVALLFLGAALLFQLQTISLLFTQWLWPKRRNNKKKNKSHGMSSSMGSSEHKRRFLRSPFTWSRFSKLGMSRGSSRSGSKNGVPGSTESNGSGRARRHLDPLAVGLFFIFLVGIVHTCLASAQIINVLIIDDFYKVQGMSQTALSMMVRQFWMFLVPILDIVSLFTFITLRAIQLQIGFPTIMQRTSRPAMYTTIILAGILTLVGVGTQVGSMMQDDSLFRTVTVSEGWAIVWRLSQFFLVLMSFILQAAVIFGVALVNGKLRRIGLAPPLERPNGPQVRPWIAWESLVVFVVSLCIGFATIVLIWVHNNQIWVGLPFNTIHAVYFSGLFLALDHRAYLCFHLQVRRWYKYHTGSSKVRHVPLLIATNTTGTYYSQWSSNPQSSMSNAITSSGTGVRSKHAPLNVSVPGPPPVQSAPFDDSEPLASYNVAPKTQAYTPSTKSGKSSSRNDLFDEDKDLV